MGQPNIGAVLALAVGLSAGPALAAETMAGAPAKIAPGRLADAEWLVGHWVGEGLGGKLDEVYLPPAGGALSGTFRLVKDGKVLFYELMTLVERDGGLVYRLKHFGPDLAGWEGQEAAATQEFPLVKLEPGVLWFGGMTLRRTGPDAMTIWVLIEEKRSGKAPHEERFDYRRLK